MSIKEINPSLPPALVKDIGKAFSNGDYSLTDIATQMKARFDQTIKNSSNLTEKYKDLLKQRHLCIIFEVGKQDYYQNSVFGKIASKIQSALKWIFGCSTPIDEISKLIGNYTLMLNELKSSLTDEEIADTVKDASNAIYVKHAPIQHFEERWFGSSPTAPVVVEAERTFIPEAPKSNPAPEIVSPPKEDDEKKFLREQIEAAKALENQLAPLEKKRAEEERIANEARLKAQEHLKIDKAKFKANIESLSSLASKIKAMEKDNRLNSDWINLPLGDDRDKILDEGLALLNKYNGLEIKKIKYGTTINIEEEYKTIKSKMDDIQRRVHKLSRPNASDEDLQRIFKVWGIEESSPIAIPSAPTPEGSISLTPTDHTPPSTPPPEKDLTPSEENQNLDDVLAEWNQIIAGFDKTN